MIMDIASTGIHVSRYSQDVIRHDIDNVRINFLNFSGIIYILSIIEGQFLKSCFEYFFLFG